MRDTELIRKTLIHYGTTQCKLPNRSEGLFYPLALYGWFTCCTSYQTGQMHFHPLVLLRLTVRVIKQARRDSSGIFMACLIAKHQIGQMNFHSLTLDDFTICNQLGLGSEQGFRWRLIYTPRRFDLQAS